VRKRAYIGGRNRRLQVTYSDAEHAAIAAAAAAAGRTPGGYIAEAALAAARQPPAAGAVELGDLVDQLAAARAEVRRRGHAVNTAVTQLHTTGRPPPQLRAVVAAAVAAVGRLDQLVNTVATGLRSASSPRKTTIRPLSA
jgi:NAD(P)-dependent dehydrogenase (short-subunit alcohol dehydrogenase family)